MARLNVGTAFLQIVASVENIHKTIAAEVAKIKDIEIDVTPNLSGFREKVTAATTGLNEVDINVRPDTTGFREKVQAGIRGIGSMDVPITVDTTRANAQVGAFATSLRAKLDAATKALGDIRLSADSTDVERKIAVVRAQLETLKNQRIGVDIDAGAAQAQIAALEAELAALGARSPNIQVKIDVDAARANLRAFTGEVESLFSKFQNANLGSTMFAGIGAAIIPALQSIGQLSGALGLIPAVATGVATALGAVVIGSQGLGEAFKAQAAAEEAATAAAKTDAPARQAVTAANQAATAAGQQNIASLQQQVTAGAAHVASLKAQQAAGANVTTELKSAQATQLQNVAALKEAQAATTGNVGALGTYKTAQQQAKQAVAESEAAHKKAKEAADAYAASLQNLAPSAREFVSAVVQLKPAFDQLRLDVQQQLFKGIGDSLLQVGKTSLPVLKQGLTDMASSLNSVVQQVLQFVQQQSSIQAWQSIFSSLATAAGNLAGAVKPILQIITDVTQVGASMLPGLATGFADAAQRAADFVSKAKDTGQLKEWIQAGIDAVKQLWQSFKDVVAIIADLTASPGLSPSFLDALNAVTGAIRWLIENVPGLTSAVQLFFEAWVFAKVVQGLTGMVTTIKEVATALGLMKVAAAEAAVAETAVGTAASGLLGPLALLAAAALVAFSPQGQAAIMGFRDALDQLLGTTRNASGQVTGFGDAASGLRGKLDQLLGVTRNADGVIVGFGGSMKNTEQAATSVGDAISKVLQGISRDIGDIKPLKFEADDSAVLTAATSVAGALIGIPLPPTIVFSADPGPPLAAAATVTNAILGIPIPIPVVFPGDPSGAVGAAGQATAGINSVPTTHGSTITGDSGNLLAAAASGTGAINGVPGDHNTAINGDPAGAVGASGTATGAINGVPGSHDTNINAVDHASPVIQYVAGLLNTIHDVTSTITTIYRTITGGAEGYVLSPMADGAVLPMARGDNLSRMSGSSAQIVPPNTWRVIGDRMSGDEAFIPITNSARSQAILGETANRMGFALMPMAGGGYNRRRNSRDERAWERLREWLERLRGGHGGGSGGGSGGGGLSAVPTPLTIGTSALQRMTTSLAFGTAGGTASYARNVLGPATQILQPAPTTPRPPGGGHGRGPQPIQFNVGTGNAGLDNWIVEVLRRAVRVQGGDVQFVLGR
jgi:hypothetical protein